MSICPKIIVRLRNRREALLICCQFQQVSSTLLQSKPLVLQVIPRNTIISSFPFELKCLNLNADHQCPKNLLPKRVHIQSGIDDVENEQPAQSNNRPSTFGPSGQRYRSYQEEAAVAPELRSQLESIGMKTRFNVNRGYGSPPPSSSRCSSFNSNVAAASTNQRSLTGLLTENEILHSVKSNKQAWQRTQSAPLYVNELQPFGGSGIRPGLLEDSSVLGGGNSENGTDENDDPLAAHFFEGGGEENVDENMVDGESVGSSLDLKRSRDMFTDEESFNNTTINNNTLPTKSFRQLPTSSRLQRSIIGEQNLYRAGSPFGLSRGNGATTLPVSAGLTQYLANGSALPPDASGDAPWSKQDFSSFTGREDF